MKPGDIKEDDAGAASRLRAALEEYRNARPPGLDKLYVPKNAQKEKKKARF